MFFSAILIGLISNALRTKVDELGRGHSPVVESNHTLILGFNDSTLTILKELTLANHNLSRPETVVILGDIDQKFMIEQILQDLYVSDNEWDIALLRYFNPVGAHASGMIGEDPKGIPNNLMPFITQVAIGKRPELSVFGNDYPTKDGTGVRDYIHVVDLAKGHVKAIEKINEISGVGIWNLGTGQGYSVLDVVKAFEKASGIKIKYKITPRRPGDIAECYCDPSKANKELGWKAENGIEEMCKDSWNWQSKNPNGYE